MSAPRTAAVAVALLAAAATPAQTPPRVAPDEAPPAWTVSSGPCEVPEFRGSLCAVGIADGIASPALGAAQAGARARAALVALVQARLANLERLLRESLAAPHDAADETAARVPIVPRERGSAAVGGIAVPRTWHDARANVHYALAVIDRAALLDAARALAAAYGAPEEVRREVERRAVEDPGASTPPAR